jgi:hypothetical protein
MELPIEENPLRLSAEPARAKLRMLSDDQTETHCIVLRRSADPQREHNPRADMDEPLRTKRRTDSAEPSKEVSIADNAVADRANVRNDREDTCPAVSKSDSLSAIQRQTQRTLRLDPSIANANIEAACARTKARMLTALPTAELLIVESKPLPKSLWPLRCTPMLTLDPARTYARSDSDDPIRAKLSDERLAPPIEARSDSDEPEKRASNTDSLPRSAAAPYSDVDDPKRVKWRKLTADASAQNPRTETAEPVLHIERIETQLDRPSEETIDIFKSEPGRSKPETLSHDPARTMLRTDRLEPSPTADTADSPHRGPRNPPI